MIWEWINKTGIKYTSTYWCGMSYRIENVFNSMRNSGLVTPALPCMAAYSNPGPGNDFARHATDNLTVRKYFAYRAKDNLTVGYYFAYHAKDNLTVG